jgi:hypothetical protein
MDINRAVAGSFRLYCPVWSLKTELTQMLARTTLALTEAVAAFRQQAQLQARFTESLRAAIPAAPSNTESAARAAQDNNTRMILQNLIGSL